VQRAIRARPSLPSPHWVEHLPTPWVTLPRPDLAGCARRDGTLDTWPPDWSRGLQATRLPAWAEMDTIYGKQGVDRRTRRTCHSAPRRLPRRHQLPDHPRCRVAPVQGHGPCQSAEPTPSHASPTPSSGPRYQARCAGRRLLPDSLYPTPRPAHHAVSYFWAGLT
jgi:hypothetical protein